MKTPIWPGSAPMVRGRGVYLRPAQQGDWADWAQLRAESRDFLIPWEPTWSADELTRNAYRRRLRRYSKEMRDGTGYAFFVFRQIDDALIGGATLSNIRLGVTQTGTLGYWMGERHAGRGHMSDAVHAILGFVFEELRLHRLEAACLGSNDPSKGVLHSTGFQYEGHARRHLRIDGAWRDHVLFAILADDPRPYGDRP